MNAPPYLPLVVVVLQDTTILVTDRRSTITAVDHRCPETLLRLVVDLPLR
jgi:hypothetical protein